MSSKRVCRLWGARGPACCLETRAGQQTEWRVSRVTLASWLKKISYGISKTSVKMSYTRAG